MVHYSVNTFATTKINIFFYRNVKKRINIKSKWTIGISVCTFGTDPYFCASRLVFRIGAVFRGEREQCCCRTVNRELCGFGFADPAAGWLESALRKIRFRRVGGGSLRNSVPADGLSGPADMGLSDMPGGGGAAKKNRNPIGFRLFLSCSEELSQLVDVKHYA